MHKSCGVWSMRLLSPLSPQSNMRDFVVWNPWEENAAKMSDFGDDEFPRMVCVEAAQGRRYSVLS